MSLSDDIMRRLAFIKYLYQKSIYDSHQPEPLIYTSILGFHDAVELFLQLAFEKYGVGSKKTEFITYFDLLKDKVPPDGLAQRESMKRLNSARVELKHNGTWPSKSAIDGFRASVTNFFQDNTMLVFSVDFNSISLVNLVKYEETRRGLEEAGKLLEKDSFDEALVRITHSFHILLDDYEESKKGRWAKSPFFFGESMTFESSFFMGIEDRKIAEFVDKVRNSIEAMRKAMKIISLGLDYRRYVRFCFIAPSVSRTLDGKYHFTKSSTIPDPSKEDCQFCFDFVIECALKLQEFDFEIEDPYKKLRGK